MKAEFGLARRSAMYKSASPETPPLYSYTAGAEFYEPSLVLGARVRLRVRYHSRPFPAVCLVHVHALGWLLPLL
eukprot:2068471-Amphidinium_carterae.1